MAEWISPESVHSRCYAHSGYPGSNFIDGNVATYWWVDDSDQSHWIILDLGAAYNVLRIRLWKHNDTSWLEFWTPFRIWVADDPAGPWGDPILSANRAYGGGDNRWETFDCVDKEGRYMKVGDINTVSNCSWQAVGYELEVEAEALAPSVKPYSFIM